MAVKAKDESGSHAIVVEDCDINFYSDIDRNHRGEIANEMPAWCDKSNVSILREEIRELEQRLEMNEIGYSYEPTARAELKAKRGRLEMIEKATPVLNDIQRDKIFDESKDLAKRISASMFSHSACMKGTPDPAVEADRMSECCIDLSDWQAGQAHKYGFRLANALNNNGKRPATTRVCATKLWQIMRKSLGEPAGSLLLQKE